MRLKWDHEVTFKNGDTHKFAAHQTVLTLVSISTREHDGDQINLLDAATGVDLGEVSGTEYDALRGVCGEE